MARSKNIKNKILNTTIDIISEIVQIILLICLILLILKVKNRPEI